MVKSATAFRTISEVANLLEIPQHVLRFWETKFNQVKPLKRGGGRRYYRPSDIDLIRAIRDLLYHDGYTIRGVQRLLRENGVKALLQPSGPDLSKASAAPEATDETSLSKPENDAAAPALAQRDGGDGQAAPGPEINKQALRDILNDLVEMRGVLNAATGR
ncbi:MAG: MerR family transcriptional regulator [Alphaproteobacteria bacterium]|nr:MerR family transcriptional regulator [Alphaproteobacteria bacterium]